MLSSSLNRAETQDCLSKRPSLPIPGLFLQLQMAEHSTFLSTGSTLGQLIFPTSGHPWTAPTLAFAAGELFAAASALASAEATFAPVGLPPLVAMMLSPVAQKLFHRRHNAIEPYGIQQLTGSWRQAIVQGEFGALETDTHQRAQIGIACDCSTRAQPETPTVLNTSKRVVKWNSDPVLTEAVWKKSNQFFG
jgi:hypothetical protein